MITHPWNEYVIEPGTQHDCFSWGINLFPDDRLNYTYIGNVGVEVFDMGQGVPSLQEVLDDIGKSEVPVSLFRSGDCEWFLEMGSIEGARLLTMSECGKLIVLAINKDGGTVIIHNQDEKLVLEFGQDGALATDPLYEQLQADGDGEDEEEEKLWGANLPEDLGPLPE